MRASFFVLAIATLIFIRDADALNLQGFTQCIGPQGQGPVCQLDAGTYPISATLLLGRSNITIKGTILASPSDTVLQRAQGFQGALLQDVGPMTSTPTLTNVTIRDLTIDGNRAQNVAAYGTYQPEVSIFTTKSMLINKCNFINSPRISVALYGFAQYGTAASGIVVNDSYFANAVILGLWSGAGGQNAASQGYLGCTSVQVPDNVVIANSQFENMGTNAIYASMTHFQLINNVFTDSHSYAIGDFPPAGGQIDLDPCTDTAAVLGNTFQGGQKGPGDGNTQGMELHGTNLWIVNNVVKDNWHDGISIGGGANIFIANWDKSAAIIGNQAAGIAVNQVVAYGNDSLRPVDFITIDHVNITNSSYWGIYVKDFIVPANHLVITNNCLEGNGYSPAILASNLGQDVEIKNNALSGCSPN